MAWHTSLTFPGQQAFPAACHVGSCACSSLERRPSNNVHGRINNNKTYTQIAQLLKSAQHRQSTVVSCDITVRIALHRRRHSIAYCEPQSILRHPYSVHSSGIGPFICLSCVGLKHHRWFHSSLSSVGHRGLRRKVPSVPCENGWSPRVAQSSIDSVEPVRGPAAGP